MWPFLGDAYHQLIRLFALILPSETNVENNTKQSDFISLVKFFISRFTSGTCSNTSNAVIRLNFPMSLKDMPELGKGS